MEDDVDVADRLVDDVIAPQVALDELDPVLKRGEVFPLAGGQIVENTDGVTGIQQGPDQIVADESGASSYKTVHR